MAKIEPKLYQEILSGLQLNNIRLIKVSAELNEDFLEQAVTVNIKDKADFSVTEEVNVDVRNEYRIILKSEKQEKEALKIRLTYQLSFVSEKEFSEAFFEIYKKLSLPLNVWPFIREYVNSLTARMNIPPLTLPLIKRN